MGNALFGSSKGNGMVHPLPLNHDALPLLSGAGESPIVRLKVRMRRGQLKELMAKSKGTSQLGLGELILQECFQGALKPRLLVAANHSRQD